MSLPRYAAKGQRYPRQGRLRPERPPAPPRRPLRGLGLVVLPFLISGMVAIGAYFYPIAQVALQQTGQQIRNTASAPAAVSGGPFTVLLLGSDDDAKFQGTPLTQSMILVRVDPSAGDVTMLSIPRDLYVRLSSGRNGKIDEAYEVGGASAAVETVQNNFDVRIDDWAWIGLGGLVKVVDLLGGIDVSPTNPVLDDEYPNDLNTQHPYGVKRIAVLPGPQHLDGEQALEYVRSRHDDIREDFGRSFRQQQVLIAMRAKAKELNVADLPDLVNSLQGQFKTSMSLERMRELLPLANRIQPGSIHQVVLVGGYTSNGYAGGQNVLLPHWNLIQAAVHQTFPSAPQ